jgi:hypothetical protein
MRFGNRATLISSSSRWIVMSAVHLKPEERKQQVPPLLAAAKVDQWVGDVMAWPDMLRLYEEISGDRLRPPTTNDVERRVKPVLREAFRRGRLVAIRAPLFSLVRQVAEEGIHGPGEELPEVPQLPKKPPQIIKEKSFLDLQVVNTKGKPLAGRRYKIELPDGKTETGKLGPDARIRKKDIDPGTAKLTLLPDESDEFDGAELEDEATTENPVRRVRLVGMLFDANKCFLLPQGLDGVRTIIDMHKAHASAKVLIVGHAEGDESNAGPDLAVQRAEMLSAYLKSKPADWLAWFDKGKPARARWGTREVQLMLSALPPGGTPHYQGYASGVTDDKTVAAVKAFQDANGLDVDGKVGPATREALVKAYMGLEDTTLADDIDPVAHGCKGHFDDDLTDDGLQPDDRRLEVFFFEKEIDPAPPGKTSKPGSEQYPAWRDALVETKDFENHGIHVQIIDSNKQPVPGADVHLEGPTTGDATADEHGFVSFFDLVAGDYTLSAKKKNRPMGTYKITYPTAKTAPGYKREGGGDARDPQAQSSES